jgi:hypothetical protein
MEQRRHRLEDLFRDDPDASRAALAAGPSGTHPAPAEEAAS